jgi:hypothetical protein
MTVQGKIAEMVSRLHRANIPISDLAYLVDEEEWRELIRYLEQVSVYPGLDLSYASEITVMGLQVKKRRADPTSDGNG